MILRTVSLRQIRNLALVVSLLIISGGIGFVIGQGRVQVDLNSKPIHVDVVNREKPAQYQAVDFSLFWKVWEELEKSYIDPSQIDPKEMVFGAISGMTASLGDPYTSFLPPSDNKQNKENLLGKFFGVGIQIGFKNKRLAVIAPLEGMAAERAGVQAGDFIVGIRDERKGIDVGDTQDTTLPEAVSMIRGEQGTQVTLRLFREGEEELFDIDIVREEILIPSVELEFVSGDSVAHLKLTQFGERTLDEWKEAVDEILSKRAEISGIILDLRNNPGGFLAGSVDIANEFLKDGTVVIQQGRLRSETFRAKRQGRLFGIQLVILVNEGSASASEIVAGALRDRIGATIVGEQTFGKGTVQEAKDLSGGAGLHVTTAEWILPSGQKINSVGLTPDVEVELVEEEEGEEEVDEQLDKAIEVLLE